MEKEVSFKSDSFNLKGNLFIPDGNEEFGGVVFYHGSGSRRNNYLTIGRELLDYGIASLAFDFRGCGESEGDFEKSTINDNVNDAERALAFLLTQKGIKKERVGLVGVSRGGHIASVVAGNHPDNIVSLILRAPVCYPADVVDLPRGKREGDNWLKDKFRWLDSPALVAIEKFKNYLLIIASEEDAVIPFEMLEEYRKRSGSSFSEIQTIKNIGHNLGPTGSPARLEFNKMVVDFFTRER